MGSFYGLFWDVSLHVPGWTYSRDLAISLNRYPSHIVLPNSQGKYLMAKKNPFYKKQQVHNFNNGRSQIVLTFSVINNAWLLYRQDGENQGNVAVHNHYEDALDDYNIRLDFIKQMEEIA